VKSQDRNDLVKRQKAIKKVISNQFDSFINQKSFTDKNLSRFEESLIKKLGKVLDQDPRSPEIEKDEEIKMQRVG
jgi:hypothetical protein